MSETQDLTPREPHLLGYALRAWKVCEGRTLASGVVELALGNLCGCLLVSET
jgi:hypothetical protein